MSLLCKLGSHHADGPGVWNDGLFFSSCRRCNAPLIRRPDESWTRLPPDYSVVWSDNRPRDAR